MTWPNLNHYYNKINDLFTIICLLAFGDTCIGISLAINTTYRSEDLGTPAPTSTSVLNFHSPAINKHIFLTKVLDIAKLTFIFA